MKNVIVSAETELTRGQKLWSALRPKRDTASVSFERARLLTASYRETEGLPLPIRRAKAFEKIVSEIPIYIDDQQLLVGDFGARPMAAEWFPEHAVGWVLREIENTQPRYPLSQDDILLLREICDYWKNKSVRECFELYSDKKEFEEAIAMGEEGACIFVYSRELELEKSWYVPDYEKAIKKGFRGILAEVNEELQANSVNLTSDETLRKVIFLQGLEIVLNAAINYAKRYAVLARELAKTSDGNRKAELERIADVCDWIPGNPARTFHEALQTMWFCILMIYLDSGATATCPGRVDQYLYPYYKKDIDEGRITKEETIQLLECFRVKIAAIRRFLSGYQEEGSSGEPAWFNCVLGGQTADGKDAVNELSYLWIEAAMRTRTPHPTLSIRWHKHLSTDFAMKAAELNSLGLGFPAWFGDPSYIKYLLSTGVTLEEARNYALGGCVLPVILHKTATCWPLTANMPKILELTLHDGFDPISGKQFGLRTGKFEDFETYDELYEAYKKQVICLVTYETKELNRARLFRSSLLPQMAASCFFDDCIKRGQSPEGGGCHYQQGAMYVMPVGLIDVADSLAAIKKCIFDEQLIDKGELIDALAVNFEGKGNLLRLLLSAPKYGNDDDYVDNIAADLYKFICEAVNGMDACYDSKYVCAPHSISAQALCGKHVGALPSGRLAGESAADGGVSPAQGMDINGPTAAIKSAGKIDHDPIFGTLFNMKFVPSALKTKEGLLALLSLIKTYFDNYGGQHLQFNVVDRDMLLDAQRNPDKYRNLVVRVAGYSALWVELDRYTQNDIIKRTEHSF